MAETGDGFYADEEFTVVSLSGLISFELSDMVCSVWSLKEEPS